MKRFLLVFSVAVLSVAAVFGMGARASWEQIADVGPVSRVNIAGFFDATKGYGVGYAGNSVHSEDGGATWTRGENNSLCRYGLDIMNPETAISFGNGSQVRRTSDGGLTWQELPNYGMPEPTHIRYVTFVDDRTGWAAGPNTFGATNDGGQTWTTINPPAGAGVPLAIACVSFAEGYFVSVDSTLYHTTDGGATWATTGRIADPASVFFSPNTSTPGAALRLGTAANGTFVYRTVANGETTWHVLDTEDGGATWRAENFAAPGGSVYLNRSRNLITITASTGRIFVYERRS